MTAPRPKLTICCHRLIGFGQAGVFCAERGGTVFLDTLRMALQPIVDLRSGRVIGHEALVRGPAGSLWEAPDDISRIARHSNQSRQLEETCKRLAMAAGRRALAEDQTLFMNVDLRYDVWPRDKEGNEVHWDRLAIEVSEKREVLGHPRALERIRRWQQCGHQIVLDDYGTGHSSLGTVLAVEPDLIKVDRYLVAGVDTDAKRQIAVAAIIDLMAKLGIGVIMEGIETEDELLVLQHLGARYGQGFLLGRPAPRPTTSPSPPVLKCLRKGTGPARRFEKSGSPAG